MNNNVDTCKCALDGIENSKYIKAYFHLQTEELIIMSSNANDLNLNDNTFEKYLNFNIFNPEYYPELLSIVIQKFIILDRVATTNDIDIIQSCLMVH